MNTPNYLATDHEYTVDEVMLFPDEQIKEICAWLDSLAESWDTKNPFHSYVFEFELTDKHVIVDHYLPGIDEFGYYEIERTKNPDGTETMRTAVKVFKRND